MSVMSPPVHATCSIGVTNAWATGKANTATRAPIAARPAADAPATTRSNGSAASGASPRAPPANVMTDLPPDRGAHGGNAWPSMAAPTHAHATQSSGPLAPNGPPGTHAHPTSAAMSPFAPSIANAGQARAQPSWSSAFQAPGLPSPTARRSTP